MRKKYIFGKKLYISILTSILVLLTTVATTFAWVGVFANSTFETFDFEIKASELQEYGIEISATGEEGTFSDSIDSLTIKRQILTNWGYSQNLLNDDNYVELLFGQLNMHQCTNLPVLNGSSIQKLGVFKTIERITTRNYFKFDFYVSAVQFYDKNDSSSFLLDAYVGENLLSGNPKYYIPSNNVVFDESFVNPLWGLPSNLNKIDGGTVISSVYASPASACRVAFEKYKVVNKNNPNEYTQTDEPISTIIFSTDKYNYPTYNVETEVYEFGGILPNESNFAILNYNQADYKYATNGIRNISMDNDIYSVRGVTGSNPDLLLSDTTNHLIDSTNENEKINFNKMMKITVSFWIEGWDADCINTLNQNPITLNLTLNTAPREDF